MQTFVEVYGIKSPDEYRVAHRRKLAQTRTGTPHTENVEGLRIFTQSDGTVRVACRCGDYPVIHLDWHIALCFLCGALYDNVVVPEGLV